MTKSIYFGSSFIATLTLTGCATAPHFGTQLTDPRPQTTKHSYAMEVSMNMKNTLNCLGCEDTVLWQNEKDLVNKVRGNKVEVLIGESHFDDEWHLAFSRLLTVDDP